VAVADSATLGERVKLLQEELAATVSDRTGRTLFVLTIVTVLALPINLAAGLFGMNVGGSRSPRTAVGSGPWSRRWSPSRPQWNTSPLGNFGNSPR
jgi:Mg2+ and Co2+ transporter CorA